MASASDIVVARLIEDDPSPTDWHARAPGAAATFERTVLDAIAVEDVRDDVAVRAAIVILRFLHGHAVIVEMVPALLVCRHLGRLTPCG
jgi:hypothetical protein